MGINWNYGLKKLQTNQRIAIHEAYQYIFKPLFYPYAISMPQLISVKSSPMMRFQWYFRPVLSIWSSWTSIHHDTHCLILDLYVSHENTELLLMPTPSIDLRSTHAETSRIAPKRGGNYLCLGKVWKSLCAKRYVPLALQPDRIQFKQWFLSHWPDRKPML